MEAASLRSSIDETDGVAHAVPGEATAAVGPRWGSGDLLRGQRVAVIVHDGTEYRLQLTRQNKLLLTK
jgi:hemin uptake protein HemP